jgi:hypothetical protein
VKRFLLCLFTILFLYLATTLIGRRSPCSVEPLVLEAIRAIQKAEVLYSITKGRGRFADLQALGRLQLIDSSLASGEKHGYLFQLALVGPTGNLFDLTAKPKTGYDTQTGEHAFYSNEEMIVYQSSGVEPPKASIENRVPESGSHPETLYRNPSCLE